MRSERECSNEKARRPLQHRQPPPEAVVSSALAEPATSCSSPVTTPKALARACSQSKSQSQSGTFKSRFTNFVWVLVLVRVLVLVLVLVSLVCKFALRPHRR